MKKKKKRLPKTPESRSQVKATSENNKFLKLLAKVSSKNKRLNG